MKIFEKSYIRAAKAPRFPQFIVRSGVPEQLLQVCLQVCLQEFFITNGIECQNHIYEHKHTHTNTTPRHLAGNIPKKSTWNCINYIVGANGTGKSLFSVKLKDAFSAQRLKVRLLSAERLAGFEKSDYSYFSNSQVNQGLNISNFYQIKKYGSQYGLSSSAFVILKERLDIRTLTHVKTSSRRRLL